MKLMYESELGSTEAAEMSWFQALLAGKGRKPLRLAPAPVAMPLQALACVADVTWRLILDELLWPGLGLLTETAKMPTLLAVPVAVSCVDDTKVVVSGTPARRTCEPLRNLLPVAVRLNAPTLIEVGLIELSAGVGLSNVTALEPLAEESAALVA